MGKQRILALLKVIDTMKFNGILKKCILDSLNGSFQGISHRTMSCHSQLMKNDDPGELLEFSSLKSLYLWRWQTPMPFSMVFILLFLHPSLPLLAPSSPCSFSLSLSEWTKMKKIFDDGYIFLAWEKEAKVKWGKVCLSHSLPIPSLNWAPVTSTYSSGHFPGWNGRRDKKCDTHA